ncbi:MAG: NifU family protein [Deltaproteobacteria bacterium]|jgi:Fe-S cluster biogenesis protein NfuA|nr:NifU family protein [Deltaproteobacteria bacterium]
MTNKPQTSHIPRLPEDLGQALDVVRQALQLDGGDIELVELTDDACARVRLTGRCAACPHSKSTLRSVVRRALFKLAPGLLRVELVEEKT